MNILSPKEKEKNKKVLARCVMTKRLTVMQVAGFGLLLLIACGGGTPEVTEQAARSVRVTNAPRQTVPATAKQFSLELDGINFTITPKADYDISAEVKSVETYNWDWNSVLSPVDFALAWQDLTERRVDEHIEYSQRNRWYYYRYDGTCPVSRSYIINHSANHHILPATENIKNAVLQVETADRIRLKGFLVNIDGEKSDGSRVWWNSSMTRSDEGDGSCEVMWVTEIQRGSQIYR